VVVVVEVVDSLAVLEGQEVDVADTCGPFEVVIWGPDVFILKPSALDQ
jgi:hypothetical protein